MNKSIKAVNLTIISYIREIEKINNTLESGYYMYDTKQYTWLHNRRKNLTRKINIVKIDFYKNEGLKLSNKAIKQCLYNKPCLIAL